MAIKSQLQKSLLVAVALSSMFFFLPPRATNAATTEPVDLNVYINSDVAPHISATDFTVTASVGNKTYPLNYVGTSSEGTNSSYRIINYHYYFNPKGGTSDPSTGWTISVHAKKSCFLWVCETYDRSISNQMLNIPNKWIADKNGVNWASVAGQVPRPEPSAQTPTNPATPDVQGPLQSITGKLQKSGSKYIIKATTGSDVLTIGGLNNSNVKWDSSPTYGKVYSCNYMSPLSNPTRVECKLGTNPPPQSPTAAPVAGTPAASPAAGATPTPTGGPVGFTFLFGGTVPALFTSGCNSSGNYNGGLLKGMPCNKPIQTLEEVERFVINLMNELVLPLAGLVFTIMIITGGIVYITSSGNTKQIEKGKAILTAAIIGLLITMLAFAIVAVFTNFIGGNISG